MAGSTSHLLGPILVTLQVTGCLPPLLSCRASSRLARGSYRFWYAINIIFYHVYAVHALLWCIALRNEDQKFVTECVQLVRTLLALCNMDILLYNRRQLARCLQSLDEISPPIPRRTEMTTVKRVRVLCALFWAVSILIVNLGILRLSYHDSYGDYLSGNIYGISSQTTNVVCLFLGVVVDLLIKSFLLLNNISFTALLHVELCFKFRSKFEQLGVLLLSKDLGLLNAGDFRQFRKMHGKLTLLVRLVDDIFSPMVLLWFGGYFASVCAIVTVVVRHQAELTALIQVLYVALIFSLITWASSSMSDAIGAPLADVYRITSRHQASEWPLFNQAHLLALQMSSESGFTAWRFFTLNRGSSLTACGALLSYVVLVIQMNPSSSATKTISSHNETLSHVF